MVPKGAKRMNFNDQLLGTDAASWSDRLTIAKLYDLGKFFFTVGTSTMAFLFTAEKINATSAWDAPLIRAFIALAIATALALGMVIAAAPDAKVGFNKIKQWPTVSVVIWFAAWAYGTYSGIRAVLPS
jgi:hypothetical protein